MITIYQNETAHIIYDLRGANLQYENGCSTDEIEYTISLKGFRVMQTKHSIIKRLIISLLLFILGWKKDITIIKNIDE